MMTTILLMVLLLFLVTGCAKEKAEPYGKGIEGLSMRFLDGMPADNLWAGSEFAIGVVLTNEGFSDIEEGYVSPRGFSESYIFGISPVAMPVLDGRSVINPDGGRETVVFNGQITGLDDVVSDYIEQPIIITSCYIYRTLAAPNVCMSANLYNTEEDACRVEDVVMESQGAPVVVNKVDEEMSLKGDLVEFYFTLHFKHEGDGSVIKQQLVNPECSAIGSDVEIPSYQQLNRIYIEDITLNGRNDYERLDPIKGLTGVEYEKVVLLNREGEGLATIKFVFSKNEINIPFKTPLNIRLKYGYREHITKNVLIKKRIGVV